MKCACVFDHRAVLGTSRNQKTFVSFFDKIITIIIIGEVHLTVGVIMHKTTFFRPRCDVQFSVFGEIDFQCERNETGIKLLCRI